MNLNIPQYKGYYGNMKPLNSLDLLTKETEEDLSEINKLEKRLNEQQQQVNALMKIVSNSQQQIYVPHDRYKHSIESERFNSQLLDEIKNLKKHLKQIESGPRLPQPPFIPPFLPVQQYPYSYHQLINQMPMPYPIQNQNPYYQNYPFQNMLFQPPQKEEKSISQILKGLAKKKEEQQLNQIMLQLLKKQQNDPDNDHHQNQKFRRNLKVKHKSKKNVSDFQFSKSSRFDEQSPQPVEKKSPQTLAKISHKKQHIEPKESHKKQHKKPQEQQLPSPNQLSKNKLQPPLRVKPTPERLKLLKKKFKYCTWMVIFYKNIYFYIMEKKANNRFNDEEGQYDDQFLFDNVMQLFVKEGQRVSIFKKSWVFTEKKDVPNRITNLIQVTDIFLKKLNLVTQTIKFDQKHLSYIRAFTTNQGYLFPTHSAFVTQRLKLNYKRKLKFTSVEQQKMVFLEYTYIQKLLDQQIFSVNGWQELLKPFAEPLKIFVSLLQYLFIDKFKNLQIISKDMQYNNQQVSILDFTKRNVADIKQVINDRDPKFQVTDQSPILGLYNETILKPVIDSPGFANLQNEFKAFVDLIYSKVE
ncbi:unnamed protein product [Paramecium sonneborni]|uniref:Uncharacterized protein n=1 Tax=Paramecium sonneborni TaxID=65129 RepID=A0A8S1MIZ5_9CILI|nr:unnamed protein product [Paramecium sonneborni]